MTRLSAPACSLVLALIAWAAVLVPAYGEQGDDEELLAFEILVFTPTGPLAEQIQTASIEPGDPRLANAVELGDEDDTTYSSLSAGDRQLEGSRRTLERDGQYEILLHEAWLQPSIEAAHAPWVRLQSRYATGEDGPMVDGRIRVGSRERFFQISLDLAYHPSGLALEEAGDPVPAYRLTLDRRVADDEIYYLDHPRFGALVLVREVEPE